MIRNVVIGRVRPGMEAQLSEGLAGIAALDLPGLIAMQVGTDAGLREGSWSFAVTNDWVDVDAYRNYDVDPEHGRFRAMIAGACDELARVQFDTA
jgi:hypothetical protein